MYERSGNMVSTNVNKKEEKTEAEKQEIPTVTISETGSYSACCDEEITKIEYSDDQDSVEICSMCHRKTTKEEWNHHTISQLAKKMNPEDDKLRVKVDAVIIDIKSGSGLVKRCKKCDKVVRETFQNTICPQHGDLESDEIDMILRTKAILDDGTGALSLIMGEEETGRILRKDTIEVIKILKKTQKPPETVRRELEEKLIAQPITVKGFVTADDYGLTLEAVEIKTKNIDVGKEAKTLLEEVKTTSH